jgi:hypothetical protein
VLLLDLSGGPPLLANIASTHPLFTPKVFFTILKLDTTALYYCTATATDTSTAFCFYQPTMTIIKTALSLTIMSTPSSSTTTTTTSSTILAPRLAACQSGQQKENPIQCSLHTLPKPLLREFHHVFGDKHLEFQPKEHEGHNINNNNDHANTAFSSTTTIIPEMLAIPTNQHARHDLVAIGEDIEEEKDRLLQCVRTCYCCQWRNDFF